MPFGPSPGLARARANGAVQKVEAHQRQCVESEYAVAQRRVRGAGQVPFGDPPRCGFHCAPGMGGCQGEAQKKLQAASCKARRSFEPRGQKKLQATSQEEAASHELRASSQEKKKPQAQKKLQATSCKPQAKKELRATSCELRARRGEAQKKPQATSRKARRSFERGEEKPQAARHQLRAGTGARLPSYGLRITHYLLDLDRHASSGTDLLAAPLFVGCSGCGGRGSG